MVPVTTNVPEITYVPFPVYDTLRRQLAEAEDKSALNARMLVEELTRNEHLEAKLALAEQEYADLIGDLIALLPGAYYMAPPDGEDLTVIEQVQRMASDAKRYVWLRDKANLIEGRELDAAIDAAIAAGEGKSD